MFEWLSEDLQSELARLAARYGQPLRYVTDQAARYVYEANYLQGPPRRQAEVCMVVQRGPNRLLTFRKPFYPKDAWRLLTGGINPGEAIFDALQRESEEETGHKLPLLRFLCAIEYHGAEQSRFATFAFLLDGAGRELITLDQDEQVEAFREIDADDLPQIATFLEQIAPVYSPELETLWSKWGSFRAVVHRLVWESLQAQVS
jgi:8-oxo-dGTP pyrophosphatase MutT (NUDIX family)